MTDPTRRSDSFSSFLGTDGLDLTDRYARPAESWNADSDEGSAPALDVSDSVEISEETRNRVEKIWGDAVEPGMAAGTIKFQLDGNVGARWIADEEETDGPGVVTGPLYSHDTAKGPDATVPESPVNESRVDSADQTFELADDDARTTVDDIVPPEAFPAQTVDVDAAVDDGNAEVVETAEEPAPRAKSADDSTYDAGRDLDQTYDGTGSDGKPDTWSPKDLSVTHDVSPGRHAGEELGITVRPRLFRNSGDPITSLEADYEILGELGRGGSGVVYEAVQTAVDRHVAVKRIKPPADGDQQSNRTIAHFRTKFLAEAIVAADLDHPNIVPVHDLGIDADGQVFYSMKRVSGTPWSAVVGTKSLEDNLAILMHVADAVAFAHSRGVVHRDLKPDNVMLGDFGEVVLMDWGLALTTSAFTKAGGVTQVGSIGGTPSYMAPEMAGDDVSQIGPHSDVYLLGAILYEILVGHPPHPGKTVMSALCAAADNVIVPTEESGELIDIAFRAMSKVGSDRHASVAEFQEAIRSYEEHSQSIAIGNRAAEELANALDTDEQMDFARAYFAFEEAVELWEGNDFARRGLIEARLAYARSAMKKGDLDLAASLIVPDEPSHTNTGWAIAAAQRERAARKRRLIVMRRVSMVAAGLLFVVVAGAAGWINKERADAVAERRNAEIGREIAVEQQEIAEEQRTIAMEERAEAMRVAKKLKESTDALVEQRLAAIEARDEAVSQRKRAEQQEALAVRAAAAAKKSEEKAIAEEGKALEAARAEMVAKEAALRAAEAAKKSEEKAIASAKAEAKAKETAIAAKQQAEDAQRQAEVEEKRAKRAAFGAWINEELANAAREDAEVLRTEAVAAQLAEKDARVDAVKQWNWAREEELAALMSGFSAELERDAALQSSALAELERLAATRARESEAKARLDAVRAAAAERKAKLEAEKARQRAETAAQAERIAKQEAVEARKIAEEARKAQEIAAFDAQTGLAAARIRDNQLEAARNVLLECDPKLRNWEWNRLLHLCSKGSHELKAMDGVTVSPDGKLVAAGSRNGTIIVRDIKTGKLLHRVEDGGLYVNDVAFSPDGKWLVSAGTDRRGYVKVWNMETGERKPLPLEGHTEAVLAVEFLPGGRRLVTGSADGTSRVYDLETGKSLVTFEGTGRPTALSISPDGQRLLTGGADNLAQLWDVRTGRLLAKLTGHENRVVTAAFSANGATIYTGDEGGHGRLWDRTGRLRRELEGHEGRINGAVFVDGGRSVLTAGADKRVAHWNVSTGRELVERRLSHDSAVLAIALHPAGDRVVTSDGGGSLRMWDTRGGDAVATIGSQRSIVGGLDVGAEGRFLLTTDPKTRSLRVWNITNEGAVALGATDFGKWASDASPLWSARFAEGDTAILSIDGADEQRIRVGDNAAAATPDSGDSTGASNVPEVASPDPRDPVDQNPDVGKPDGGKPEGGKPGNGKPVLKDASDRYFYGPWKLRAASGYHYMPMNYRERPNDREYKSHFALMYPGEPRYVYFYDPGTQRIWGRYLVRAASGRNFQFVDPKVKVTNGRKIDEKDFLAPEGLPKVPGAIDATAHMIPPPYFPVR